MKPRLRKEEALSKEQENKILDHSGRDLTMVYFPAWKRDQKNKWVHKRTFNSYVRTTTTSTIPTGPNSNSLDQSLQSIYIDGLEAIGDLSRRPQKDKWLGKTDFSTTVKSEFFQPDSRLTQPSLPDKRKIYKNSILSEI